MSKREQCSLVTEQDLRRQLAASGNLFAASPPKLASADICLPQGTTMQIGPRQVIVKNAILQIAFALEDTGERGGNHTQPQTNMLQPRLADGEFRFDTRVQSFDIQATFFGLHAYDTDKPAYEAWSSRMIEVVKAWFACC